MQNVYEICFYGGLVLAILLLIAAIVLFVVLKIPKVIGELSGSTAKKAMKEMQDGTAKPGSVAKKEQEKYYNMGSGKITAKETVSSKEERKTYGNDSTELLDNKNKKEKKFEETDVLRPGVNDYETPDDGETEVLGADNADETTDILRDAASAGDDGTTDVLRNDEGDDGATDVLRNDEGDDGATDVLRNDEGDDGATDVLRNDDEDDSDATDVLRGDEDDSDATDVLRADEDEEGTSVLTTGTLAAKVKVIYNIVVVHSDESIETGR
ncbi:hypothetical protein KQI72_10360 [Eubacterium sp. MSJ-21]|nr:hypothetical protein [Eubacterium sp. MSJ-21]